jgi:hypothetical protein
VSVIKTETNTVGTTIPVGVNPQAFRIFIQRPCGNLALGTRFGGRLAIQAA